ncbi:MAG: flavin oxidoreductase/NADH oxidase [Clostridia bacterium]|nr:flavin oxidoreductase/NADH oxidase [Clostridia bacterium]
MAGKLITDKKSFDFACENSNISLPYLEDTKVLGESVKIGKRLAPNRIVYQAMEGCDGTSGGSPDELTKRRYARFARGGAGIIWFEATAVMREGRANPRQLYINDKNLDDFKREVEQIKEICISENGYEPLVIMQATHSGRYSKPEGTPAPLIAYNNPIFEKDNPISEDRIVSDNYLDDVREALIKGAILAEKAGFDGVDIKCCHRYLNSELLSAYNREGRYGGSFVNRTRLLRESVSGAVANTSSDFIVSTRLNVYDGFPYPYGFGVSKDKGIEFDNTEPIELIKELKLNGVNLVNITMGNPYFNPHVNRPFVKGGYEPDEEPIEGVFRMLDGIRQIKQAVPDIAVISSGISYLGNVSANVVAACIEKGWFDFAGYGRMTFANPNVAKEILSGQGISKTCLTCSKCTEIMRAGGTPGCPIYDKETYMPLYNKYCKGE